jgi:hypothetical protein
MGRLSTIISAAWRSLGPETCPSCPTDRLCVTSKLKKVELCQVWAPNFQTAKSNMESSHHQRHSSDSMVYYHRLRNLPTASKMLVMRIVQTTFIFGSVMDRITFAWLFPNRRIYLKKFQHPLSPAIVNRQIDNTATATTTSDSKDHRIAA